MNKYVKYPRTPHLPFSESYTNDDKLLPTDSHFYNFDEVVVTTKMDGENTTVYWNGKCHARSIDSQHKEYHSWLMNYIQFWYYNLPIGSHICGEYMFAKHSIFYEDLPSYFLGFSFWIGDCCVDWDTTVGIFQDLNIVSVPVLYKGKYDQHKIITLAKEVIADGQEGIVVRNASCFHRNDFDKNVAKYVRKNHVQTDQHWTSKFIMSNRLKEDK